MLVAALAVAAILGAALTAGAWEREPLSVFHERRARLIRDTGGDGVVVLYGYGEADVAASVTPFRQNEEFYYLTGWNEPEAIMLLGAQGSCVRRRAGAGGRDPVYSLARPRGGEMDGTEAGAGRRRRSCPHGISPRFATSRNSPPTSRKRSRAFPEFTPSSHRNPRAEKNASRRRW